MDESSECRARLLERVRGKTHSRRSRTQRVHTVESPLSSHLLLVRRHASHALYARLKPPELRCWSAVVVAASRVTGACVLAAGMPSCCRSPLLAYCTERRGCSARVGAGAEGRRKEGKRRDCGEGLPCRLSPAIAGYRKCNLSSVTALERVCSSQAT